MAGVGILVKGVYPAVIKPWFDMDDRIASLQDDLAEQEEKRDRIDDAMLAYKHFVERTGDTDPMKVRNHLQGQLEDLIRKQRLESPETRITPKRPTTDRKTGVHTVTLSVAAEGRLEQLVRFVGKCYELPYIMRFKDLKLTPAGGKAKNKNADRVRLSATLDTLVLPKDPKARDLDFDALQQPVKLVKHSGEPLAMIWDRKPFNEYVKPKLPPPPPPPPTRGSDSAKTPTQVAEAAPQPKKPTGDPNRKDKYLAGVMRYGQDELMIIDPRRNTTEYIAKGEKLDGGNLLYVHPYGGVVHKEDGDYFYEIGLTLDQAVLMKDGTDLSEVDRLVMGFRSPGADLLVEPGVSAKTPASLDRTARSVRPATPRRAAARRASAQNRLDARQARQARKLEAKREAAARDPEAVDASEQHKMTTPFQGPKQSRGKPRG